MRLCWLPNRCMPSVTTLLFFPSNNDHSNCSRSRGSTTNSNVFILFILLSFYLTAPYTNRENIFTVKYGILSVCVYPCAWQGSKHFDALI